MQHRCRWHPPAPSSATYSAEPAASTRPAEGQASAPTSFYQRVPSCIRGCPQPLFGMVPSYRGTTQRTANLLAHLLLTTYPLLPLTTYHYLLRTHYLFTSYYLSGSSTTYSLLTTTTHYLPTTSGSPSPAWDSVPECSPAALDGSYYTVCGSCEPARCRQYEVHATPLYEVVPSMESVMEEVLANQIRVREKDDTLPPPLDLRLPAVRFNVSNALEALFPSAALEVPPPMAQAAAAQTRSSSARPALPTPGSGGPREHI